MPTSAGRFRRGRRLRRKFLSQKLLLTAEGQRISESAEMRALAAARLGTAGSQPRSHTRVNLGDVISMQAHCVTKPQPTGAQLCHGPTILAGRDEFDR